MDLRNLARRIQHVCRDTDAAVVAAWIALVALVCWRVADLVSFDFRAYPLAGDQTNFVMQAQSLAHAGHDLTYDAVDFQRWVALGWADQPYGLFFRHVGENWIFGKPYSYSLYLAPFMWLLGDVSGIAVANALLLVALTATVIAILRIRYSGATVPLATIAFVYASSTQFYAWVVHAELLLALGVGVATLIIVRVVDDRGQRLVHICMLAATLSWLFSEKATMGVVFLPIVIVILRRITDRHQRTWFLGVGVATLALCLAPYLWYSNGQSWNPYQGDRLAAASGVPFDGLTDHPDGAWINAAKDEFFSTEIVARLAKFPEDIPRSLVTTVVGRHTGLLAFAPMAFLVLVMAALRLRMSAPPVRACLAGIVGYLVLYAVLLPRAYTGGSSFGNRYFVQIGTMVVGLLVLRNPRPSVVNRMATGAIVLSLVMIGQHQTSPRNAYNQRLGVTSPIQRLLPPETQLVNWPYYACPYPYEQDCLIRLAPKRATSGVDPPPAVGRVPVRDVN